MSPGIRDAATVVVLREAPQRFEVLLLRRHERSGFMPGAYVFPGGTVDAADADPALIPHLRGAVDLAQRLGEPHLSEEAARALFIAGARETLEEAGLWLTDAVEFPRRLRSSLLLEALQASEATLDLMRLSPWYRWITPPSERRRYDARFFLTTVPPDQCAEHDGHETTEGLWLTPADALDRAEHGTLNLPPPTMRSLELLEEAASIADVLDRASQRPPPVVDPLRIEEGGDRVLVLPGDRAHPQVEAVAGEPTRMEWTERGWRSRPRANE